MTMDAQRADGPSLEARRADGPATAFFDVDGTLTVWHISTDADEGQEEPEEQWPVPRPAVYDAFSRMRQNGHATFICTGRPIAFVHQPILDLNPTGIVAGAGAYVRVGDTVVRNEHIDDDLAVETARRLLEAGIDVDMETDVTCLSLFPSGAVSEFENAHTLRTMEEFEPLARKFGIVKFCMRNPEASRLERVLPFCLEHYTVCDLQGGVLEFSLRGVDKAAGIACALEALGRGRANTYAFGDSENDLSMVDAVETFVAMGNALPNVKERAAYVTDSVDDDGVATGLAHFGLI